MLLVKVQHKVIAARKLRVKITTLLLRLIAIFIQLENAGFLWDVSQFALLLLLLYSRSNVTSNLSIFPLPSVNTPPFSVVLAGDSDSSFFRETLRELKLCVCIECVLCKLLCCRDDGRDNIYVSYV